MKYKEKDTETLIETRGECGFAICAPTYGTVNPDGEYKLKSGGLSSIPEITPSDRKKLFTIARTFHVDKAKGDKKLRKSHVELALELAAELPVFHDEHRNAYCFYKGSCFPIRDREITTHISHLYYKDTGKALSSGNLNEVLTTLEGKALHEGEERKLHNRIAFYKGCIYYDLGDGKAVRVKPNGKQIVKAPKIFRRYGHQQVQVRPLKSGNPWKLYDFMNISKEHKLLTLVSLISYLIPDIAHPIFHPHGAQGSAKSTMFKIIKRTIDPSSLEIIITPKNKVEVIRAINRHHLPLFDNLSKIDSDLSDILCTACTGGGIAKRTLYTDDDEQIFNVQRCIGVNGINLLMSKPDLLDRSILIPVERISPSERKVEAELLQAFDEAKPAILGGMFNTLAKAMAIYPNVYLDTLPRLADFAKWGYAVAEALKKGYGEKFISAYQANIKRQNAEVLHHNTLCLAVTQLMRARDYWEGTFKKALEVLAEKVQTSKTDRTFPTDTRSLRPMLKLIQTTLEESANITYRFSDKARKDGYHIEFFKKQ